MVIYKITNTVNGRVYIGQTVGTVGKRWNEHSTSTKNSPLYNAFRKYGKEKFAIEVICCALAPEYLNELECYFIYLYNSYVPNGYNLTSGGDSAYTRSDESREKQRLAMLGRTHSAETKAKISEKLMGKFSYRKGVTLSEQTRQKISEAQIGKRASEETKAKMSQAHKERLALNPERTPAQVAALEAIHEAHKGTIPWNKGKKASEEQKAKQSAAHKGKPAWNKGKPMSEEQKLKLRGPRGHKKT